MSNKFVTSNLLVDLSTEEQQLLSGGQTTDNTQTPGNMSYPGQPTDGGQPLGGQPTYGGQSGGYGYNYPIYVCRPINPNDGGNYGSGQ
jgi:hypothetical protein